MIYYGEPSPFNAAQEIYIEFVPERTYVESGIWTFRFLGTGDEETAADLWLPSAAAVGRDTEFLESSPDTTLTIPSTAFRPVTGTSFAAPLVTGAAALLMEWGIVRENDPYLYGEKVKAYLRKGARRLPSELAYPNPRLGYGALCVADSLPK